MREIKFRAWDTERRQMFITFELKQKLNNPWGTFDDNIIFLQYTGLKDKRGQEIYEGDIVKAESLERGSGCIEWDKHGFWIIEPSGTRTMPFGENMEVISNIYEESPAPQPK